MWTQCSWTQRTRRQGVQPEQTVDINQRPSSYVKIKQQTQYMTPSVLLERIVPDGSPHTT